MGDGLSEPNPIPSAHCRLDSYPVELPTRLKIASPQNMKSVSILRLHTTVAMLAGLSFLVTPKTVAQYAKAVILSHTIQDNAGSKKLSEV
jgi:hypothetical protein